MAPTPPDGQDMSTEFLLRPAVSLLNIDLGLEVSDHGGCRRKRLEQRINDHTQRCRGTGEIQLLLL